MNHLRQNLLSAWSLWSRGKADIAAGRPTAISEKRPASGKAEMKTVWKSAVAALDIECQDVRS